MSAVTKQISSSSASRITPISANRKTTNAIMTVLMYLAALVVVSPLILIFAYLLREGFASMFHLDFSKGFAGAFQNANLNFFTQTSTHGGMKDGIFGSIEILAMASVIGVTVGLAGGIFLSEYPRHPLMPTIRMISDVLGGIPAIVMGLVAYSLIVLTTHHFSGIAGALALGFLMIPIVVRTSEEVLKLVPLTVREAGLALGLPKWLVTLKIVLPAAAGGIVTGVMLALARVAGEAAPLLFTSFGNTEVNFNPMQPMSALPKLIYDFTTAPSPESNSLAKAGALLLILMIFFTSLLARHFSRVK